MGQSSSRWWWVLLLMAALGACESDDAPDGPDHGDHGDHGDGHDHDHDATVPKVIDGGVSVWAQYTIETEDRDGLAVHLREQGVPSAVYYPIPIHRQTVYSGHPTAPGGLPVTDAKAGRVISLPMHPYLTADDQDQVIAAIRSFVKKNG